MKAFGTRPAPRTAATAASRCWPTVCGTATRPRETLIVTVEPRAACEPACGLCATTVSVGWFEVTLDPLHVEALGAQRGHGRGRALAEHVRDGRALRGRDGQRHHRVAKHVCARVRVLGDDDSRRGRARSRLMRAIRPRCSDANRLARWSRMTFGTFTVEAPLLPLSRVSSQAATRPPITSASRSSSHGQSSGRGGGSGGGGGRPLPRRRSRAGPPRRRWSPRGAACGGILIPRLFSICR